MRHFRHFDDVSSDETRMLVESTLRLKKQRERGVEDRPLAGRVLGLLFEKPSLRTRVSFQAAFAHLGGASIFLPAVEIGLGARESVTDVARSIGAYVDLLAVRTFSQKTVDALAEYSNCPVINALSDEHHPCQALADVCTIEERFGACQGVRLTFVGDGNNVARSLAHAAVHCGMEFVLCAPAGFEFRQDFLESDRLQGPGHVRVDPDPKSAVAGADVVYTDVWASMGQEAEKEQRLKAFAPYQVNAALMAAAKPNAVFMHCLPAHRGEEVTAEVIDGPASVVFQQAENRLHSQKALMYWLLTTTRSPAPL